MYSQKQSKHGGPHGPDWSNRFFDGFQFMPSTALCRRFLGGLLRLNNLAVGRRG